MEAKDTVMNTGQLQEAVINKPHLPMGQAIAGAQAKITWDKAIREVVEWIEEKEFLCTNTKCLLSLDSSTDEWQSQKKAWGIK